MLVILFSCMTEAASTITKGNDGTDMVGAFQNYCQLQFPDDTKACDYNFETSGWGSSQYLTNIPTIYDRTLFVGFSKAVFIRSVYMHTKSTGCYVDLYVTTAKIFTVDDVRLLCKKGVWSNGVYNCPSILKGTYLGLMTNPGSDVYYWKICEIRAWSRKDIANSASITFGGVASTNLLIGPSPTGTNNGNYQSSYPAVINLGSFMQLQTVWISHYGQYYYNYEVSTGTTAPNNSQSPGQLSNVAQESIISLDEEWYFDQTPTLTQYILIYSNQSLLSLRKVAAFGVDNCSSATSVTTSLVTAYSSIVYYFGNSITIAWPSYSITPSDCFIPVNFIFKDSAGTLLAPQVMTVNWVAQTITYLSQSCHYPHITIQAEFNTLNAALGSIDLIPFTSCPCASATITSQTFASPADFQINLAVSNPVTILNFMMNADSVGQATTSPMKCGLKKYSTGLTWLTVLTPADPLTQNFQLQVQTNDYNLAGTHSVSMVVAFVNANIASTVTQTLTVTLLHPCKATVISFSFSSLPVMTNNVFFASVSQSFALATDSVTILSGIASFCGPIQYSIIEIYPFLSVTAGYISLGSNSMTDIGTYTATLKAQLQNYTVVTPKQVAFQATLSNPCLTTTLSLPTTLVNQTIQAISIAQTLQDFAPATDTAATSAAVPELCGVRVYSILETFPQGFVSIVAPTSNLYISNWTLSMFSNSVLNVGIWTVTLQAKLQDYTSVAAVTKEFTVSVQDPCVGTIISFSFSSLPEMTNTVSLASVSQSFTLASDSVSISLGNISFCGPIQYQIIETYPFLSVTAGNISLGSNSMTDIGTYTATLQAQLQNYTGVSPKKVTFQATLTNPCLTTTLALPTTLVNQTIQAMSAIQTLQDFAPATDTAATSAAVPELCGVRVYSILETFPQGFVSIVAPTSNMYISNWTLSMFSNSFLNVGIWTVTLQAMLQDYTSVAAVTKEFIVTVQDPCVGTIISFSFSSLPAMKNTVSLASVSQSFDLATDSVTNLSGISNFCGPIQYSIIETYPFLSVTAGKLSLGSNSTSDIGTYLATLKAILQNYPEVTPAQVVFSATLFNVCSLINAFTVTSLPETIFIGSSHTYTVINSLAADCIQSISVVQQNTTVLPTFMRFDSATNILTVKPKRSDFGAFNLDFTVTTIPTPESQITTVSYLITILKVDLQTLAPEKSIAYTIQGAPIKIAFPKYSLPAEAGVLTYELKLEKKTPVFKDNLAFNSTAVTQYLPQFITFDSGFITIVGDTFSEGWNSYNFQVLASLEGNLVNDEFLFTVDAIIDCQDAEIIPKFNSTVNYLVYTPTKSEKIAFSDTKSSQTGIQGSCGPIRFNLNITDNELIKPLPSFVKLNSDEIKINCNDDSQVGSYTLLVDSYFEMLTTAKHSYFKISLNLSGALFSVPIQETTSNQIESEVKKEAPIPANLGIPAEVDISKFKFKQTVQAKAVKQIQAYATCKLEKISNFGLMRIKFSENVKTKLVPQKFEEIINLKFLQVNYVQNSIEQPILMSYNITNFTSIYIEVQLQFDEPLLVSANRDQSDEIKVKLSYLFLVPAESTSSDYNDKDYVELKQNVPKMVGSKSELASLQSLSSSAKKTSMVLVLAPTLAQFFAKGIMQRLWAFFHAMQLIESYSKMSKISLSINAQMLADGYHDIINAKLLPDSLTEKILEALKSKNTTETSTANFTNTMATGSRRRLNSNRTIKLAVIAGAGSIIGISVIITVCLIVCWRRVPKIIKDQITALKHMIFFNGPIRAVLELFYPTICLSLINIMSNEGSRSTMISSGFKIVVCVALIPFSLNFVIKYKPLIEDRNFHLKYGALFSNVERLNKPKAIYFPPMFLIHRLLMAVLITCMGFNLVFQVFLLTHLNLLMLCWLITVWPMDSSFKNWLEIINGFLVLVMSYFSFLFSDYVPDPRDQYKIGFFYIGLILFFLVFNVSFQIFVVLREFYLKRKNKKIALAQKEAALLETGKKDKRFLTLRERLKQKMDQALKQDQSVNNENSFINESIVSDIKSKKLVRKIIAKHNKKKKQSINDSFCVINQDQVLPSLNPPKQDEPKLLLEPDIFFKQVKEKQTMEAEEKKRRQEANLSNQKPENLRTINKAQSPQKSKSSVKTVKKVKFPVESSQNLQIEEEFPENPIQIVEQEYYVQEGHPLSIPNAKSYDECLRGLQTIDKLHREQNALQDCQKQNNELEATSNISQMMRKPFKTNQNAQIQEETNEDMNGTNYGFASLNSKQYARQLKADKRHEEYMIEQNIKIFHLQPPQDKKAYQIEEDNLEEQQQPNPKKQNVDSWSNMSVLVSDHDKDISSRSNQHDWGNEKDNNEIFNDLVKELDLNKVVRA